MTLTKWPSKYTTKSNRHTRGVKKTILAAEPTEQKRGAFPGNNTANMNILDPRLTF